MISYDFPQMKYSAQKELISIIVPIYNTKEIYLRECLDSILSQTFTNYETILVNDGSTDNTRKIIDEYVKKDSRFIAIHKQNQGTLLARKTGLENSKGEFIASIDSDDIINQRFLEKMHKKITEKNYDLVYCKFNESSQKVTDYWSSDMSENITLILENLQGMLYCTWNKLIKREIYAKIRFPNVHITFFEDPIQIVQIAYNSKSVTSVLENLYFYRDDGMTKQQKNYSNYVRGITCLGGSLNILFNGTFAKNVEEVFYRKYLYIPIWFLLLSKKERQDFENDFKSLLPGFIKHEKKLRVKILLILANKGVEFPFKFYEWIKNFKFVKCIIKKNRLRSK